MRTLYVVISIGNSDDKLPQKEWNQFVTDVNNVLEKHSVQPHFFGGAPTYAPWQNMAWIIEVTPEQFGKLPDVLEPIRKLYKQDTIFFLSGSAIFLGAT